MYLIRGMGIKYLHLFYLSKYINGIPTNYRYNIPYTGEIISDKLYYIDIPKCDLIDFIDYLDVLNINTSNIIVEDIYYCNINLVLFIFTILLFLFIVIDPKYWDPFSL